MNIALGGLIIYILLLPGVIFYKNLFSENSLEFITNKDFFLIFYRSSIPALIFYTVAYPFVYLIGYNYNFEVIFGVLSSNDNSIATSISKIQNLKLEIISFLLLLNIISYFFSYFLKKNHLKFMYELFQFKPAYYNGNILNGELFVEADLILADVLVQIGNEAVLYNGVLEQYGLSKEGKIENLALTSAKKRKFNETSSEFVPITGSVLYIEYKNVTNLNLAFFTAKPVKDDDGKSVLELTKLNFD